MTYDIRSGTFPRLGTSALRVVANLAEMPVVGPLLVERLKRDGGLTSIRDAAPDEAPTLFPHLDADERPVPALVHASAPHEPLGFRFPGLDDYHAAFREARLTPVEVAERFLAQHAASDSGPHPLRAMIAIDRDDLMRQARSSAERWRAGRPLGLFDGVPIAIKDEMDVAGYPTTVGTSFINRGNPAREDCAAAGRLRAAGALLVGKANMHEIGINVTGLNPHHGSTRNPYNDRYHTGASSSGPATAVASGLVPVAIGADGGGSIRIPAALCGLVGIKATFGRVSEFGAYPLCWSLAYIGPLATSVLDCARTYEVVAGADPRDPHSLAHPAVSLDEAMPGSLAGVRLGVFWPWFRDASPEVAERCETLLRSLVERGATLVEVDIPELEAQRVAHIVTITSEMASQMMRFLPEHRAEFGLDVRVNLAVARSWRAQEYVAAQRIRTRARALWDSAFRDIDAIVTPTTGQVAPMIDENALPHGESDLTTSLRIMRFAFASNLTGHPAITMPAGYDREGLPVGLQAIGRPWGERLLFRIAAAAEQLVERRGPQRWYPTLER
ncbi:MAG: amidase [Proteobacteria bacterium]|nr:amidase [Pseudomonadota bacterium]